MTQASMEPEPAWLLLASSSPLPPARFQRAPKAALVSTSAAPLVRSPSLCGSPWGGGADHGPPTHSLAAFRESHLLSSPSGPQSPVWTSGAQREASLRSAASRPSRPLPAEAQTRPSPRKPASAPRTVHRPPGSHHTGTRCRPVGRCRPSWPSVPVGAVTPRSVAMAVVLRGSALHPAHCRPGGPGMGFQPPCPICPQQCAPSRPSRADWTWWGEGQRATGPRATSVTPSGFRVHGQHLLCFLRVAGAREAFRLLSARSRSSTGPRGLDRGHPASPASSFLSSDARHPHTPPPRPPWPGSSPGTVGWTGVTSSPFGCL